jgi:hypothetical protein
MNQPVRYVAMVFALLISAGEAFALDTVLSPLYISGKVGVSVMQQTILRTHRGSARDKQPHPSLRQILTTPSCR